MKLIAHRGLCRRDPENTLAAFQAALAFGSRELETDIRQTPDGTLVLMHDEDLSRVAGSPLGVRDGLAAMREAHPVATLDELLAILPGDAVLHLDLKDCDPERLLRAAAPLGARATLASADLNLLRRVKAMAPGARYGFQPRTLPEDEAAEAARELGAESWRLNADRLDERWIARARREKLGVFVYPVDTPEAAARMRALGVDAVFTRYPDMESVGVSHARR